MPINYKDYHPKWSLIRLLILKRAEHKCEECGVQNYSVGFRDKNGYFTDVNNEKEFFEKYADEKRTKIILTIAHLNHDKKVNRFWNLKALCQRCHLRLDIHQHIANRKYGRDWKRNQNTLEL